MKIQSLTEIKQTKQIFLKTPLFLLTRTSLFVKICVWRTMSIHTDDRSPITAISVTNHLHRILHLLITLECTVVKNHFISFHFSVISVTKHIHGKLTWPNVLDHTVERNSFNVISVTKHLHVKVTWLDTLGCTTEKKLIHANYVANHLNGRGI